MLAQGRGRSESGSLCDPFDRLVRRLEQPLGEQNALATAGQGRFLKLVPLPPVTGVDKGENQPAAYVRFLDKTTGEPISTHLLSVENATLAIWAPTGLNTLEEVKAGGHLYEVYLRYKRINKPYTITLNEVRHDNYLGTDTARDYSSKPSALCASRLTVFSGCASDAISLHLCPAAQCSAAVTSLLPMP